MGRDSAFSDDEVRAAWQCASILLDYPGTRDLAPVEDVVPRLPRPLGDPLREVLASFAATPVGELERDYVATFDTRRRCNLFLTYFAHGDTRKRGMALLRFRQAFTAAGVELLPEELPDHLAVVLEFAATVDLAVGRQLLLDHRAGVELLRLSLRDDGSRWAPLLEVVCRPLPVLRGDERDAVRRLAEQGPPTEEVGLAPYGAVDLPMPTVAGRRA